jgi:hypothetical protein
MGRDALPRRPPDGPCEHVDRRWRGARWTRRDGWTSGRGLPSWRDRIPSGTVGWPARVLRRGARPHPGMRSTGTTGELAAQHRGLTLRPYSASIVTVTPAGGQPLAGCTLGNTFLPAQPLQPGTTYMVSATLNTGTIRCQSRGRSRPLESPLNHQVPSDPPQPPGGPTRAPGAGGSGSHRGTAVSSAHKPTDRRDCGDPPHPLPHLR